MNNQYALEISNISKQYKDGFTAINNVSFRVNHGDFFALLGPNGAGKSTILGMISSLINITKGTINIYGYNVTKKTALARKNIGVMPQEVNLNAFETPKEILVNQAGYFGISRRKSVERADVLLTQLNLANKRDIQVRFLSGGMKRRLMVARALIHNPKLLILDEPTAGVDVELRKSMWDYLLGLNKKGLTIILTTHYLEEAESMCNNILLLKSGQVYKKFKNKEIAMQDSNASYILELSNQYEEIVLNYSQGDVIWISPCEIEVIFYKNGCLNDFFKILSMNNIEVSNIRPKESSLEKIFLNSTKE